MEESRPSYAVVDIVDGAVTVARVTIAGDVPALFVADAVARLDLAARNLGWSARLGDPDDALAEVVTLLDLPAG